MQRLFNAHGFNMISDIVMNIFHIVQRKDTKNDCKLFRNNEVGFFL
jgi:hypothetical protein